MTDTCNNFSSDTFFGFKDDHGVQRYLKNMVSTVAIIGIDDAEFRNVPHFIDMVDRDLRDMYHETDAGKFTHTYQYSESFSNDVREIAKLT